MAHYCSTAVVRCIDFRLNRAIKEYLKNYGLGEDFDLISVAGGVKDREYVLNQAALSKKLHGIQQVILINHTDCGGYGGREAFASPEEEKAKHAADLQSARAELESKFPGLIVHTVLADVRADNRIYFEEV